MSNTGQCQPRLGMMLLKVIEHERDLSPLQVLLLENVRFHKQEDKNDPEFAKHLKLHNDS